MTTDMIDLSTKTYDHSLERTTDDPAGQVDDKAEHAKKRNPTDHQAVESNAPKRQKKKHKLRIHSKEAGHSIVDLPSLCRGAIESDKLSAAEILKSLGLDVSGVGKSAGVWFVGVNEQTEDKDLEVDISVEGMESLFGGPGSSKAVQ